MFRSVTMAQKVKSGWALAAASAAALIIVFPSPAVGAGDGNLLPISRSELITRIRQTPLRSPQQGELISRAYVSGLAGEAYRQYTALWRQHPNDAFANLRRGVAAAEYWRYATQPSVNEIPLSSPDADRIDQAAATCLANAVSLAPRSAAASAEYGNYLFYKGYMSRGVALMKAAETMDARAPVAHALLGEVYASPNPPYYQPKAAEAELRLAIRLAPSDSYPHWVLANLYVLTKQYQRAQSEMALYLALAPPQTAQRDWVKRIQSEIAAGLGHAPS